MYMFKANKVIVLYCYIIIDDIEHKSRIVCVLREALQLYDTQSLYPYINI